MKATKLVLITIIAHQACFAQEENMNKELMKSSKVYDLAVANPQICVKMLPVMKNNHAEDMVYYMIRDVNEKRELSAMIVAEKTGTKRWITQLGIEVEINSLISVVVDPIRNANTESPSDSVEVAITGMQNGQVYELDYGIVKRVRIKSEDNSYLEKLELPNGSSIIMKDKLWVKTFTVKGFNNGYFYLDNYKFN